MSSKWLELMHEIAPHVSRVAFMYNPNTAPFSRYFLATFRSAAPALAVEPIEAPIHSAAELEAAMTMLGREASAGLIIMSDTSMILHRELIISLADRYRLPTIYPYRLFITPGGLISYGVDNADLLRGAASYVNGVCGMKSRTNFQSSYRQTSNALINLKTAKALGLTIPPTLLATTDEIVE